MQAGCAARCLSSPWPRPSSRATLRPPLRRSSGHLRLPRRVTPPARRGLLGTSSPTPAGKWASPTAGAAPRPTRASTAQASSMPLTTRLGERSPARPGTSSGSACPSASPGSGPATCSSPRAAATSSLLSRRRPRSRRRKRASASATCRLRGCAGSSRAPDAYSSRCGVSAAVASFAVDANSPSANGTIVSVCSGSRAARRSAAAACFLSRLSLRFSSIARSRACFPNVCRFFLPICA